MSKRNRARLRIKLERLIREDRQAFGRSAEHLTFEVRIAACDLFASAGQMTRLQRILHFLECSR